MAVLTVCRIVLLLSSSVFVYGQQNTACSLPNRDNDLDTCLTAIKSGMMDKDRFWFGTKYSQDCPGGPYSSMVCNNLNFPNLDSIGTRVFPDGLDLNLIDRYVKVSYTSEAGTYQACGTSFTEPANSFEIVPTSGIVEFPWFLRDMPMMTWDAAVDDMYAMVYFDVGNFILHLVQVNIPGSDMAAGENLRRYNGPKVSFDRDNVYAYFLFKQPGAVNVSQEWLAKINSWGGGIFSLQDFAAAYNFTGPVGVNWLEATGDPFAANYMEVSRILNNCPAIVGTELDKTARPFLPNPSYLSVGVDVHMMSDAIEFSVCCKRTAFPTQNITLNAFDNTLYNTAEVRSQNTIDVTLSKAGLMNMAYNFTGDIYTLITIDPDVPNKPNIATERRPLMHMMVVNIQNGDFSTGEVVLSYNGPTPPNDSPHYYYFLLYKQTASIANAQSMTSYAGNNCPSSLQGRCLYDIDTAVAEKGLTLVGANWMRAVKDDYVIYRQLNQSDSSAVEATCSGRQDFSVPCATDAADRIDLAFITILICAMFAGLSF